MLIDFEKAIPSSFILVFHSALPDLQRMKHKPDQAFGHREVFCLFLYQRAETLTHLAAFAVFAAHDHPSEITRGFGV